jgi:hypothetical protein
MSKLKSTGRSPQFGHAMRDAAARMFAAEVTTQLLSSNTRLVQGPPVTGAEAVTDAGTSAAANYDG